MIQHKLISRYVICPFSVVDERMNVKVFCNVVKHCCQETAYTNIKLLCRDTTVFALRQILKCTLMATRQQLDNKSVFVLN